MNFKGAAKRIDDIDLPKLGHRIGVGEDELHAFIEVETHGSGFDDQGRPRILFEQHIFFRYLPKAKHNAAKAAGFSSSPGNYGKSNQQYTRLAKAMAIDEKAALFACSWGLAQIMGFNHTAAGYPDVYKMIEAFKADEENHLEAAINFILINHLDDELRDHNWKGFAKGYNGSNYHINEYDTRLADSFIKWKRIKDTPWSPGQVEPADPTPTPEVKPEEPKQTWWQWFKELFS